MFLPMRFLPLGQDPEGDLAGWFMKHARIVIPVKFSIQSGDSTLAFSHRMHRRTKARSRLFTYADIFELGPHRFAGVELEGDDSFLERQLRVVVGEIHY